MAGKQVVSKIQLGNNATASQNFLISEGADGTMKIQRGNDGGALTDVLTIGADGKITSAYDVAAGQLGLTANGYAKLANGLIIQWGEHTAAGTTGTVTLPVTFPSLNASSIITDVTGGATTVAIGVNAKTTANFTYNAGTNPGLFNWIAIGY